MLIYMQIGPADKFGKIDPKRMIHGTSKDRGHLLWIPVVSFSVSGDRSGHKREALCYRVVDGTSAKLFKMALPKSEPVMIIVDMVDGTNTTTLKFTDAVLSKFSTMARIDRVEGKGPIESMAISFTSLQVKN